MRYWGDRDIAFREGERRWFERLFPSHRTVILRGAGHFIQEDAPDEIVEAIEEWWDQERLSERGTSSPTAACRTA